MVKVSTLDSDEDRGQAARELAVYTDLAPRCGIPTPRLVAHHSAETWSAIALTHHAAAPPAREWNLDGWRRFARMLARVHRDVQPVPAIFEHPQPEPTRTGSALRLFAEQLWNGPGDSERMRQVLDDFDDLRRVVDTGPVSFVHGDCHLENVLLDADEMPMLVDWQSARVAPSAGDLAFAFTRAAPSGAAIPRDEAMTAYCAEAGAAGDSVDEQIAAHQLLVMAGQYPAFAGFLDASDVVFLRREFDEARGRWREHG